MTVRYEHQTFILVIDYNCTIVNTKRLLVFQLHVCWHVCATSRLCVCSANDRFRKSNICLFRSTASELPASAFFPPLFVGLIWTPNICPSSRTVPLLYTALRLWAFLGRLQNLCQTPLVFWPTLESVWRSQQSCERRKPGQTVSSTTSPNIPMDLTSVPMHLTSLVDITSILMNLTKHSSRPQQHSVMNVTKHSSGPQQHSEEPHQTFQWTATAFWWTSSASQ